jgi:hypothetical protein
VKMEGVAAAPRIKRRHSLRSAGRRLPTPLQALATVGFRAIKLRTFPKKSIGGGVPPNNHFLAAQLCWFFDSFIYGSLWECFAYAASLSWTGTPVK